MWTRPNAMLPFQIERAIPEPKARLLPGSARPRMTRAFLPREAGGRKPRTSWRPLPCRQVEVIPARGRSLRRALRRRGGGIRYDLSRDRIQLALHPGADSLMRGLIVMPRVARSL